MHFGTMSVPDTKRYPVLASDRVFPVVRRLPGHAGHAITYRRHDPYGRKNELQTAYLMICGIFQRTSTSGVMSDREHVIHH